MTARAGAARGGPRRIGFLLNPIAGMGGRVGLKGTDGVVARAIGLGAVPTSGLRAHEALQELRRRLDEGVAGVEIEWLTCSGAMGADCLEGAGFARFSIAHSAGPVTGAADTRAAVGSFLAAGAELVLFCGGDGTARDVCSVTGAGTPILGIPAGVKMFSGVFGASPQHTAELLLGYLRGVLDLAEVEVLDIDEECYRRGEWSMRLHAMAQTPFEPSLTQGAKALVSAAGDLEVCAEIADDLRERFAAEPEALFLLGAGGTLERIAASLGIDKTLLGVDAVVGGERIAVDLAERELLQLLDAHPRAVLVLSPIGAQGFVLGRGNQQLSPPVLRRIGPENLLIVATSAKLQRTPLLRFDTGDRSLDAEFARRGHLPVLIGYHLRRLVPVAA